MDNGKGASDRFKQGLQACTARGLGRTCMKAQNVGPRSTSAPLQFLPSLPPASSKRYSCRPAVGWLTCRRRFSLDAPPISSCQQTVDNVCSAIQTSANGHYHSPSERHRLASIQLNQSTASISKITSGRRRVPQAKRTNQGA